MNQKKVSIILPVYNAEEYLCRCLNSVLKQDYQNIELIALNDGSTDQSLSILNEYKNEYVEKLIVVDQENIGVSMTRNKGIQMATGEYLMFIDNDDYFDDGYISKYVNEIESGDYEMVLGGYKRPDINGRLIEEVKLENKEFNKFKVVAAWAKIFRTSFIKENSIQFLKTNIGEDIPFTIVAVNITDKIKMIDYIGYNWFYNEKSVSSTSHKSMSNNLQFEYMIQSLYKQLSDHNVTFDNNIEYYFVKTCVWYFLYASRKTSFKIVDNNYKKIFGWLNENFPNYLSNTILHDKQFDGDSKLVIKSTRIFTTLIHLHLIKPVLWAYSKI